MQSLAKTLTQPCGGLIFLLNKKIAQNKKRPNTNKPTAQTC